VNVAATIVSLKRISRLIYPTVPSSVDKSFSVPKQVKTGIDVKAVTCLLQSAEEVFTPGVRMSCLCFLLCSVLLYIREMRVKL